MSRKPKPDVLLPCLTNFSPLFFCSSFGPIVRENDILLSTNTSFYLSFTLLKSNNLRLTLTCERARLTRVTLISSA